MSNLEEFEKWLDQDVDDAVTVRDVINTLATKETAALSGYEQRQPEIDALKAALSKSNANMERVERDLYLKINELEAEVESLERRLIEEKS